MRLAVAAGLAVAGVAFVALALATTDSEGGIAWTAFLIAVGIVSLISAGVWWRRIRG